MKFEGIQFPAFCMHLQYMTKHSIVFQLQILLTGVNKRVCLRLKVIAFVFIEVLSQIRKMILQTPRLYLEPNKTQYFHFNDGVLTNCGKSFDEAADDSSKTVNFLGFSFDSNKIRIRAKTISKYYYRMNRKAKGVVKLRGKKTTIKPVPTKGLYMSYSQKGANSGLGNFLTYVDRAVDEFGNDEAVKQDTRRHMQKIRKALNHKL